MGENMSQIIVKAQRITEIKEHPNADRLEIACIGAWETCVKKDVFAVGDLVVFIPPDAILNRFLHTMLGITQYCGELPKTSREAEQGKRRVRAARLRGVKSFGTLMTIEDVFQYYELIQGAPPAIEIEEGDDLARLLNVTKYEPPEKILAGDQEADHALFPKYTDIERFQNFPDVLVEGERVVMTEKIHGTNCRIGLVMTDTGLEWMAGSHRTRRKDFDAAGRRSLYWKPLIENHNMCEMIQDIQNDREAVNVIVFGEIYGPGIQDMQYDGKVGFRVFDILVNGEYLSWDDVEYTCGIYGIETVPVLYTGPFSVDKLMEVTDGPTTVCPDVVSKFKGREGCVVKPVIERASRDLPNLRVILKSVSADYLERRGATDNA